MRRYGADANERARHGRVLLAAAVVLPCWIGPARAADYIITITGDDGATFGGTCLSMVAQQPSRHAASGRVPHTLHLSGDLVSCAIQKKTGSGHLRIVIRRGGGEIVTDNAQEQPFGVILAAGH